MIRDKAWLANVIEIMGSETSENYPHEQMVDREVVLNLIDQLDEPEVLSKEWVDKHITDGHNVNLGDKVVYADELDGVLVPKQELPVIPKFVADWIETTKKYSRAISALMNYEGINNESHELALWCFESGNDDNLHNLARAWLDGYEIEKEPLYLISLPVQNRGNINMWWNTDTGSFYFAKSSNLISQDGYKCAFTEKEIKSIDPRYWLFAELMEEE